MYVIYNRIKKNIVTSTFAFERSSIERPYGMEEGCILVYARDDDPTTYALEALRNDRSTILAAVAQDGLVLEYTSSFFKDDEDVVRVAVEEDRNALEFASKRLKKNVDVVKTALQRNGL